MHSDFNREIALDLASVLREIHMISRQEMDTCPEANQRDKNKKKKANEEFLRKQTLKISKNREDDGSGE